MRCWSSSYYERHNIFGVIVAFIMYVRLFANPLSQIAQSLNSMQSVTAASERVFEFLEEKEMTDESKLKGKLNPKKLKEILSLNTLSLATIKTNLLSKTLVLS